MLSVIPSPQVCVKCKGRLWCGPKCFILERFEKKKQATGKIAGKFLQSHSPPGVFVSWTGYPKITFSPMAPAIDEGDISLTDDSDKWFGLPGEKIISFRENLVRASIPVKVTSAQNPDYKLMEIQQVLLAKKPVGVEIKMHNSPLMQGLSFSDFHAPMGPQARLASFSLTENPSTNQKIERFYSDTDAKTLTGLVELYKNGVGVNQLHKLLSAGMLGVKKSRRFVPTRWSIVATDSQLSEYFIDEQIKHMQQIQEFQLFLSNYLENYFFVLLVPKEWSYELLEVYKPGASWNKGSKEPQFMADHEFFTGRTAYANNTVGGYYAVRMALTEYLAKKKRQATVIVFREIGDSGLPAIGVWKCRETVRNALKKQPLAFKDLNLAIKYLETKLTMPLKYWKKNSKLLDHLLHQKKIIDFT